MKAFLRSPRAALTVGMLLLLALVPPVATALGQPFYLTLVLRMMVYGLAALSLNLLLGYGGMVSFGHALYLGVGAYAVGILSHFGVSSGWAHLAAALGVSAAVALLTGLISLRTAGIAFIMITLAFAQMFFFLAVSLRQFGGDEGMTIPQPSDFGLIDLGNRVVFYYTVFGLLLLALYGSRRLIESRFGMVLRGSMGNEPRMRALGFPTLRYRLTAYVISACVCSIAGLLLANLTGFTSPDYMAWTRSGELIVMVVLGGMGTLIGPVVGATGLLLLEEVLSAFTEHWMIVLGPIIVWIALVAKRGIVGLVPEGAGDRG
ncbi:MAG: branched-chain amino acid ABC transporter permease [Deferrisomatales bacterium]|nr:branched-chain amino acid ABC transporter permease [Deferrisomatales bacterium]